MKSLKSTAQTLVRKLEQERSGRTLMLGKVVKTQSTTPVVLNAEPALQAAFVECVVDIYAKLGTPKGGRWTEWFRRKTVPNASAEVVRLLLRRSLPFADASLAGMLEKLSRVSYLSLVEFKEQMVQALEKHPTPLSPAVRKAAARYADALAIRHVSSSEAKYIKEECGFPRPADLKAAERIKRVLGK